MVCLDQINISDQEVHERHQLTSTWRSHRTGRNLNPGFAERARPFSAEASSFTRFTHRHSAED